MLNEIIVGIYIIFVLMVGLRYSRRMTSMRDFALANQDFPGPVILASVSATFIGAEFVFGFAQQSHSVGLVFLFPLVGWCVCKLIIADLIVPRVARFRNAMTVGDIMAVDYGLLGRITTGLCGAVLGLGFAGAQISACGLMLHYFFELDYFVGIFLACTVVVIYSALGGFRAVAFTDLVQFAVLIVAIPIVCNFELSQIGGLTNLLEKLPKSHIVPSPAIAMEQAAWFFIFLIPLLDPAIMQRIMMDRDEEKIATGFRLSALTDIPIYLVVCLIGLIAFVKNPGLDSNLSFPYILSELPNGIKGLAVAGVFAVTMSTADSFLNAASVSLVHDVIKPCLRRPMKDRLEVLLAQVATVLLGFSAIFGALKFPRLLDLIIYFQNISWMPLIMAPLYATLFGLGANRRSFIIAGTCGIGAQVLWPLAIGKISELFLALISLTASCLGLLISHFLSKRLFKPAELSS